jgi:hypothetical protein
LYSCVEIIRRGWLVLLGLAVRQIADAESYRFVEEIFAARNRACVKSEGYDLKKSVRRFEQKSAKTAGCQNPDRLRRTCVS